MTVVRIRSRQFDMEAAQLTAENRAEVAEWATAEAEEDDGLTIFTSNGDKVWAQPGDWIIRGTTGQFFVRSDDAFREQYEPVYLPVTGYTASTHRCGTCRRYVILPPEHRGKHGVWGRCPECGGEEVQFMPVEGIGS